MFSVQICVPPTHLRALIGLPRSHELDLSFHVLTAPSLRATCHAEHLVLAHSRQFIAHVGTLEQGHVVALQL